MSNDQREAVDTSLQKPPPQGLSRRNFLRLALGGLVGAATGFGADFGARVANNRGELGDVMDIVGREASTDPEKSFRPESNIEMLPMDSSERIYQELQLGSKYPDTINVESFHLISQRVWRLANLNYQENNPTDPRELQIQKFEEHCKNYLAQTMEACDEMSMDLVACLLLWQVSGANTSSAHAITDDIRDERVRSGLSLVETLYDRSVAPSAIAVLRELGIAPYYSLARVEGRLTLGTHDIEMAMIARSLLALKEQDPSAYSNVVNRLSDTSPAFISLMEPYIQTCDEYEAVCQEVVERTRQDEEILGYLRKFHNPDAIRSILTTAGRVDNFPFSRTTGYWAEVAKLQALTAISGYVAKNRDIELSAIGPTIKFYLEQRGPEAIFFDNCSNPKFLTMLERDAVLGNRQARALLDMANSTKELSDRLIAEDRQIGAALIRDRTELDQEFQILTGVAYAKWLLCNARTHQGLPIDDLSYSDPNQLAFDCFQGTAHRETGASYQLAGTRPLHRASLPFETVDGQLKTMDDFIAQVYLPVTNHPHPRKDFRSFLSMFASFVESCYLTSMFHTDRFRLNGDTATRDFVLEARRFGAEYSIITPPHCSWQRAMEATIGYTATISGD